MSEHMRQTILDMTWCTILEGNIPDNLWPEIVLAMVNIKNLRLTKALNRISSYEALEKTLPILDHLMMIRSMVYILIHKEKRYGNLCKFAKFTSWAQKNKLIGYDDHTIYQVFLKQNNAVIRVKDLQIFENTILNNKTALPTYKAILIDEQGETASYSPDISFHWLSENFSSIEPSSTRRKKDHPKKSVDYSSDTSSFHQLLDVELLPAKEKRSCLRKLGVKTLITKLESYISDSAKEDIAAFA